MSWSFVIRNFLAITVVKFVLKIENIKHRITKCRAASGTFETHLLTLVFTLLDQEVIVLSLQCRRLKTAATTTATTTSIIILNLWLVINSRRELHRSTETFLVTSPADEVCVGFLPEISSIWTEITVNIE